LAFAGTIRAVSRTFVNLGKEPMLVTQPAANTIDPSPSPVLQFRREISSSPSPAYAADLGLILMLAERGIMTTKPSILIALIALIPVVVASAQDTKGGLSIQFKNTPVTFVADYVAKLTHKPVVMQQYLVGVVDYEAQGITSEQALKELSEKLEAQNMRLLDQQGRYWKLVEASRTNQFADAVHIQVEILPDSILVESQPVARGDFAQSIKQRLTPETEIWIHDASSPHALYQETSPTGFRSLLPLLAEAKVRPDRIYRLLLPRQEAANNAVERTRLTPRRSP
jgi:hypothetical protein